MAGGNRSARGAILIWSVFAILMLGVLVAVVVNVGHLGSVRGELQNAVDAAALASARELSGRAAQLASADAIVDAQATEHHSDRHEVAASVVRFGTWTPPGRTCPTTDVQMPLDRRDGYSTDGYRFCEVRGGDEASAFRVNAVYVRAERADTAPGGGSVPMLFSGLLGRASAPVAASAIAVTGGPCGSGCIDVPMVVGVGCLTDAGALTCDPASGEDQGGPLYALGLSSTQVRSAGWSVFSTQNPSQNAICDYLKQSTTSCTRIDVGAEVELIDIGQGSKFDGGCKGGTNKKTCDWFAAYVGQTIEVPVISRSGSLSEACPSTYNGTAYIVGFATFRVLAVDCKTGNGCVPANSPWCATCDQYASGTCVVSQLVCNHLNGPNHSTGCAWTGTSPLRPVLVR
ncbi:MAG: pilus assembly protein TadG-related protein [Anaeromyxobacteraceae bacterium]